MQLLLSVLEHSPVFLIGVCLVLGLLIGSFLNVVIYRLPVMMNNSWRKECREYLELEPEPETKEFNLIFPLSHCPHCNNEIRPQHNIPVFSYLFLKGRCADCGSKISWRYPAIEALTGLCSAVIAWHFGYGVQLAFALLLTWVLIAASFIDIDHYLLPDSIILPTLWVGIFLSLFAIYTDMRSSIIGALAGYLTLWTVYQIFKLATGKEGMGFGDFKLLALLGAWLGWQYLPLIIILSSVVGLVFSVSMVLFKNRDYSKPLPFGPYLAAAGWLVLIWGEQINRFYLHSINL